MSGLSVEHEEGGNSRATVLSKELAPDVVILAEAGDITLNQAVATVDELIHLLTLARDEEARHQDGEEVVIGGLLPPATGCGLLVDNQQVFSGIVTTRDLIVNIPQSVSGTPLNGQDLLSTVATPAEQVCSIGRGDSVNYLLRAMTPSGDGFRHVPCLSRGRKPLGVFLLKHVLAYALRFVSEDDTTTLAHIGLRSLKDRLLDTSATIADVVHFMKRFRRRCVFIVDSSPNNASPFRALGLISEWDIIRTVLTQGLPLNTRAVDIMTESIESCEIEETIRGAAEKMLRLNHHQLMITSGKMTVGIVSLRSLIDHIASYFPDEVFCLEPRTPFGNKWFANLDGA